MSACSTEEQCLEDITVGDKVRFDFEFYNPDATEKDISGMSMVFTMNRNEDKGAQDLKFEITFPEDSKSQHGKGQMVVPAIATKKLKDDTEYKFKFRFHEDSVGPETLGSGLVQVVS